MCEIGPPRFVMIVEDDDDIAQIIRVWLAALWPSDKTTYLIVHDMKTALCVIGQRSPDIVLADLRLPDSTGIASVQTLVDELPIETPVVAMSGYLSILEGQQSLWLGANNFLSKLDQFDGPAVRNMMARAWARTQGYMRRVKRKAERSASRGFPSEAQSQP